MVFVPNIDKPLTRPPKHHPGLVHHELPKIPVYQNVRNYLRSKVETQRVKKLPEWDIPRCTPATELVRARRDLHDADERLEAKRKEYVQRRITLDAQWEELRQKEEALRASFLKFNIFTKENEDKRERADRKIKEESAVHIQREEAISELQDKVQEMNQIKDLMEKYVNDFKFYEHYLEQVVGVTDFKEIPSLLNRYETLAEARAELACRQTQDIELLENTRQEMMFIIENKTTAIIGFNTKIAELENRFEKARANALRWESAIARVKALSEKKKLEIRLAQSGVWNMYNAICHRKGIEVGLELENTEDQLMYIKTYLVDLKKIIRSAKKKAIKDLTSVQGISHAPKIEVVKVVV